MERLMLIYLLIFVTACVYTCAGAAQESEPLYKAEKRLKDSLLLDYDKTIHPQTVFNNATEVKLGMGIIYIENMDEDQGILTTHVWLRMRWSDNRLKWNASDYKGLDHVMIPITKVWIPDFVPYNYAGSQFSFRPDYSVVASNNGNVLFVPHARLLTMCSVNLEAFPFDQQNCSIELGSWIYHGNIMSIVRGGLDTSFLVPNPIWDFINATDVVNTIRYDCCSEPYYDYTVNVVLRRHSHILVHMYVGPGVCLGLMIPVIFILPAFSTYKLILGGTLLIAQVLMMNQLADSLPTSHSTAPTISLYMLANIVLLSLSLACSTVIIYCWEKAKKGGVGVPAGIDKVFLGIFGRLMRVRREDYIDDSDTGGAPSNVVGDNANVQTDDSATMVKEYTRLVAPAEWRQLSVVCDRLLFVIFFLITIITMAAMVRYTY